VIHCDIKSQNVLLTAGLDTAKIADVGVAQLLGAWDPDNIGWTFAYAAPELLLGQNITSKVGFE
jgi:serine/threonine protein kinase